MPLLDDKVTDDTGVTVSLLALKSTEIAGHVIEVPQPQIVIGKKHMTISFLIPADKTFFLVFTLYRLLQR